jgi:hypothetical protein
MAKIQEEIIIIKVSKLIRDSDSDVQKILSSASVDGLEAVIQELSGENVLVEITQE